MQLSSYIFINIYSGLTFLFCFNSNLNEKIEINFIKFIKNLS